VHHILFVIRRVGTERLDTLVLTRSTRRTCRDVTSQVECGL